MHELEIHLDHVDVDLGEARILHDLTLSLSGSGHFAVLGDNGAGKTTLLRLLVGELWPSQRSGGTRTYVVRGETFLSSIAARPHMRFVAPDMADWYQRHELQVPVWEVICAGLRNTPFLYHEASPEEREQARVLGSDMGLITVLDRPMRAVSTGQAKRALLARAMIAEPKLLAVDELGQGLDRRGRFQLLDSLERIAVSGRTRLLVSGQGVLAMPDAIRGRIYLEHGRLADGPASVRTTPLNLPKRSAPQGAAETVLDVRSCTVVMDGLPAVDSLTWAVQAGESWGVLGHNGSGKSTLLQMITGYRRPWPGGSLTWFGQAGRFDVSAIRDRIGILAPWIKEWIEPEATCRDVLLSGLCGGLGVHRGLSEGQMLEAEILAGSWDMADWLSRPIRSMSYGQARQVMLARAVVHGPELVVLDEPFSGLDASWQGRMAALLRDLTAQGRTVVLATHTPEFTADLLSHGLILERGRDMARGPWGEICGSPAFARLFGPVQGA